MSEKIKADEFIRVCRLAQLVERNAKIPTFTIKSGIEGIELVAGKINYFLVDNAGTLEAQKIYNQPVQDKQIASVIGAFELPAPEPPEKKGKGNKNDQTEKTQEIKKESETKKDDKGLELAIELPEFLTHGLMTKWSGMSTTERILMFQRTPKDQIYDVVVGKNRDTGKNETAPYVKGNYMFKEANAAFLFDWNISDISISVCPTGVSVSGKLNGWFTEYGKYLSRPAQGYQELNSKIDIEQAKKGATTDAIKKGLSLFGFNSDVYSGEV